MKATCFHAVAVMVVLALAQMPALGQTDVGTAFTYQGQLKEGGSPAEGDFDFVFRLFDAPTDGTQIGSDLLIDYWPVSSGLFTMKLDFGDDVFTGDARWLEVAVRPGDSGDPHTVLSPRQELTPTPYALYALAGPGSAGFWAGSGNDIYNTNIGNVGIGTLTPSQKLDVEGTVHVSAKVLASAYASNSPYIMEAPLGTERARILESNGNFGMGTTNPQRELHVAGDAIRLSDSTGTKYIELAVYGPPVVGLTAPAHDLYIESSGKPGNNRVIINPWAGQGNVGIGTTSPDVKLQVEGGSDVTQHGGGYLQMGGSDGPNLALDDDEIMARAYGETSQLHINREGGNVVFCAPREGNVGIGTNAPYVRLQVEGGWDADPNAGGYLQMGGLDGVNLALDNDEIMARNDHETSTLHINREGGDVLFCMSGSGGVGIGTWPWDECKLHVQGGEGKTTRASGALPVSWACGVSLSLPARTAMAFLERPPPPIHGPPASLA